MALRVLLQRVSQAEVHVDGRVIGAIGRGLALFIGFGRADDARIIASAVDKIIHLRVFPDDRGRFHFDVQSQSASVLAVPQFTLYADTRRGRRPDFTQALAPELATTLFDQFVAAMTAVGVHTECGRFGADMDVHLVNHGPVTMQLEFPAGSAA